MCNIFNYLLKNTNVTILKCLIKNIISYKRVSKLAFKVKRCLLRDLLKKSDITQQELADLLDVKIQQVNKYVLNKQKMSIQVAKNIAYILDCTIDDLYDWEWTDHEAGKNE